MSEGELREVTELDPREKALRVLEEAKFIQRIDGQIICDLDRFRGKCAGETLGYEVLRQRIGPLGYKENRKFQSAATTFWKIFENQPVYSQEDFEKRKSDPTVKPRFLFYAPENEQAAVSQEKIKNKNDFYLGLWEIQIANLPQNYPTKEAGFSTAISSHEAVAACIIFNPLFGNGYRDQESGRLMVRYKNGETKPISWEFFRSWRYYGKPGTRDFNPENRPAEFFLLKCPHLVDQGDIKPFSDFRIRKESARSVGYGEKRPRTRGTVMADKVQYTLGSEFEGTRSYFFRQLSDDFAALYKTESDGTKKITHIYRLGGEIPTGEYPALRKDDRRLIPIDRISELAPEALFVTHYFEQFLEFSQRLAQETRISLAQFPLKDQNRILSTCLQYKDNPQFWVFTKKYRVDGLQTLVLTEALGVNVNQVWKIGEEPLAANSLFEDAAAISELLAYYEDKTRKKLESEPIKMKAADEIANDIRKNAACLLLASLPHIEAKDIRDVLSAMHLFRIKVSRMYAKEFGLGDQRNDQNYQNLLETYTSGDSYQRQLALSLLGERWEEEADIERRQIHGDTRQGEVVDTYYKILSSGMEQYAAGQTADTPKELGMIQKYINQKKAEGQPVQGTLLDLGCGTETERITQPLARMLPGVKVIGIERRAMDFPKGENVPENLTIVRGDITQIPMEPNSVEEIHSYWSVLSDLVSRRSQLEAIREMARVLIPGGRVRIDLTDPLNYAKLINEYHQQHPDKPMGTFLGTFGGFTKAFSALTAPELIAMFNKHGFEITEIKPWETAGGKKRMIVEATLERKINEQNLDQIEALSLAA